MRVRRLPAEDVSLVAAIDRSEHVDDVDYKRLDRELLQRLRSAGLRFDYHGGLAEKYGKLFNFDPSRYSYDASSDTITSNDENVCERAEPTQRLSQPALLKVGIAIVKRGSVEDARALMRGAVVRAARVTCSR